MSFALLNRLTAKPGQCQRVVEILLDSGKFENRAALARYLGVSRARVTQVLRRLGKE